MRLQLRCVAGYEDVNDAEPPSAPPGGLVKTRQQRKNPPRFGVHLGNPGKDKGVANVLRRTTW